MKLAYLSQGKLFVVNGDGTSKQIESPYGRDLIDRTLQRQSKNKWKSEGDSTLFSRGSLWGTTNNSLATIPLNITAVATGVSASEIIYSLDTGTVGGLFSYDLEKEAETRRFHRENLRITDLSRSTEHDLVACSQHLTNGIANIGLCRKSDVESITEGDSVDEAPSWVPGAKKQLVFQSAGVARNAQGYAVGLGAFAIHKLDLEDGSMGILKEEEHNDFLSPHLTKDGSLLVIRRPYESFTRSSYAFTTLLTDTILFPFRLLRAIFHYLNFLSLVYSKKPLTTASGPKIEGLDKKTLLLRGQVIDAEKVLREGYKQEDVLSLVPASWQLVKYESTGKESILAKGVVAYDIDTEGDIIYTNGNAIYRLDHNGEQQLIIKAGLIDALVALS